MVIMQLGTVKTTVNIPYHFIGTDTVLYHFILRGIHHYIGLSVSETGTPTKDTPIWQPQPITNELI